VLKLVEVDCIMLVSILISGQPYRRQLSFTVTAPPLLPLPPPPPSRVPLVGRRSRRTFYYFSAVRGLSTPGLCNRETVQYIAAHNVHTLTVDPLSCLQLQMELRFACFLMRTSAAGWTLDSEKKGTPNTLDPGA
jgi:hypothetical protein